MILNEDQLTRCPVDLEAACEEWGANCGPCALAALLGRDLADVRPALSRPGHDWPGYTNPTIMLGALAALGLKALDRGEELPPAGRGLVFVQLTGPWERYPRQAYKHTHWIAYAWTRLRGAAGEEEGEPILFTYDCNWGPFGAWMPLYLWETSLAPRLIRWHSPKATGWRWRKVYEVAAP